MLYREIIAVCSQIHTKHINTLCGQNIEFFNAKSGAADGNYSLRTVTTVYRGLKTETVNVDTPRCSSERPLRSLIHL